MAVKSNGYLTCPLCDAEIPLDGDEKPGTELYCPYCLTTLLFSINGNNAPFFEEDC